MVNEQQLRGSWNEIRGQLREHWGQLTGDDVVAFGGNVDQLVGLIQRKTGESRQAIENYLNGLVEHVAAGASQLGEAARRSVERAGEMGRQAYDETRDRAARAYGGTRRMIEQRPATSLAALFAAGLIAGMALGLFSSRR